MWQKLGMWFAKQALWFVASMLWRYLTDEKVQNAALQAVENAANMDIDNDGKREHARSEIVSVLKERGWDHGTNLGNALVELALLKAKELKMLD